MAVQTVAMASTTRSGRRADSASKTRAFAHQTRNAQNIAHHGRTSTNKRQLGSSDRHPENPPAKRSRSSDFEIVLSNKPAHDSPQQQGQKRNAPRRQTDDAATTTTTTTTTTATASVPRTVSQRSHQKWDTELQQQHQPPPTESTPADANPPALRNYNAQKPPHDSDNADQPMTKHQAKVINGIRHELKSLQPTDDDVNADPNQSQNQQRGRRKLRSQEASRFKSELSAYFPDYDEVIGNEPKEQHLLNVETPIVLVDSFPRHFQGQVVAPLFTPTKSDPTTIHHVQSDFPIRGYGDALFDDLFDSQRINFDFLGNSYKGKTLQDPLSDELYLPVHKKAERLEKSIRNTEKGRAQHEKDQIMRLLDGLLGHDWLRTMGVSGVTESKKKTFEPARQHFIKGCQAILDKFRQWGVEEKRRKAEKERALAEEAERAETAGEEYEDEEAEEEEEKGGDGEEIEDSEDEGGVSESDPNESDSDVDASIAKQLRDEAAARSRITKASRKRPRTDSKPVPPPKPAPPQREFKSFFKKKHERDAALNKHRRAGRRVLAWGEPVPDMGEHEFELPEDYRDPDTMKAHARKRRRELRNTRH